MIFNLDAKKTTQFLEDNYAETIEKYNLSLEAVGLDRIKIPI